MEAGNKKIYVIMAMTIIVVVSIIVIFMTIPQDDTSAHNTNVSFFKHFLSRTEEEDIKVITLERYFKDGYHYYDVVFEEYDYDIEAMNIFHLVYYGNFESIDGYFCPDWEDKGDLIHKYNAYVDAKESGEHYVFSVDEIEEYMVEYYRGT